MKLNDGKYFKNAAGLQIQRSGDNFASFKNALLNGKTPQEAAFSTATGAWSLELGYSKVVLEPAYALQIKNGLRSNISVDFTK